MAVERWKGVSQEIVTAGDSVQLWQSTVLGLGGSSHAAENGRASSIQRKDHKAYAMADLVSPLTKFSFSR